MEQDLKSTEYVEREYHHFVTKNLNDKLLHLRTTFYVFYNLLYLYCSANSSYYDFPFTSNKEKDQEAEREPDKNYPGFLIEALNKIENDNDKKIAKRQLYYVFNEIIPKHPRKK